MAVRPSERRARKIVFELPHHLDGVLVCRREDELPCTWLVELQHSESGELVCRVLFASEHRNTQHVKQRMPGLMHEHVHERTCDRVRLRQAPNRWLLSGMIYDLLDVLVANRNDIAFVRCVCFATASRELNPQNARQPDLDQGAFYIF